MRFEEGEKYWSIQVHIGESFVVNHLFSDLLFDLINILEYIVKHSHWGIISCTKGVNNVEVDTFIW